MLSFCQINQIIANLLSNNLALNVGLWISCLFYEHRKPEIDVFLHNIDGIYSHRSAIKKEIICGEELNFLNQTQIEKTVLERKFMAAQWLAPLIDALFRSGRHIEQQPMFIAIQLIFMPYLRSNSLYQKLGAALVAQAWAQYKSSTICRVKLEEIKGNSMQYNEPIPTILVYELEQQLSNGLSTNKLYDEVAIQVDCLSRECNEFQQYCVRKGVPREELIQLNQANSMEDIVLSSFQNCEKRIRKAEDKQALTARHVNIVELIQSTKIAIKTYTNRILVLFSSAIFHFSDLIPLPSQLTPLIKPLMEALELENNLLLVDMLLSNAFASLFEKTSQRQPCPHPKISKQLSNGLSQCENYAPKPANWTNKDSRYQILLMNLFDTTSKKTIKALNCELVLRKICEKFGYLLNEKCPEMLEGQCMSLDESEGEMKNLEPYLIRLNFFRTIFPVIASLDIRMTLIDKIINPKIGRFMELLGNENPAIRFRTANFIAEIMSMHLCSMLKSIYKPMNEMISGELSSSEFARCGAVELLVRIAAFGEKLLGLVSLFAQLALRTISDNVETIRNGAAFAFRQLVILLPIENRQKHFLKELSECEEPELSLAYNNSFSLVDLLTSPGNLPKLRQEEIPWLRENISLRAYQIEGITWLTFLRRFGLNGVLADDMGLGKTLQILSLLAWEYGLNSHSSPTLVVCPRTLVDHWCKEWNSYFLNAKIKTIKLAEWKAESMKSGKFILIISYEELRGNRKLMELHWNYVVLDEGHCIRNPTSQLFEVACSLKSTHRLILSGTPVQNSPADLWALFTFLMPGYLLTRAQFQAKYMRQIMACRNPKATEQQIKDGENTLELLHKQCLPFLMRRLKSEVLTELPEKQIQDRLCELSQLQKQMYQFVIEHCSLATEKSSNSGTKTKVLSPLQALHILRRLVDHPSLVIDQITKMGETMRQQLYKLFDQNEFMPGQPMSAEQSGKIRALRELLVECQIGGKEICASGGEIRKRCKSNEQREGEQTEEKQAISDLLFDPPLSQHRALIFCQWRSVIELLVNLLECDFFGAGIKYLRLDGTIPPSERQNIVDRFNADTSIDLMLLTTQIGGVGLNLIGADVVIFMDHDWNPFRDLQAIDRAHRLGQQKTVNVYRLISQGTVEEKVLRLQKFKTGTANALVGADNRSLVSMASDKLLELFTLGDTIDSEPRAKKKARLATAEEMTDMEAIWGNDREEDGMEEQFEQYAEQHSIQSFLIKSEKL